VSAEIVNRPLLDSVEVKIVKEYLIQQRLLPHNEAIEKVAEKLDKSPGYIKAYLFDIWRRLMEVALKKLQGEPLIVTCERCNGLGSEQRGEGLERGICYQCKGNGKVEIEL